MDRIKQLLNSAQKTKVLTDCNSCKGYVLAAVQFEDFRSRIVQLSQSAGGERPTRFRSRKAAVCWSSQEGLERGIAIANSMEDDVSRTTFKESSTENEEDLCNGACCEREEGSSSPSREIIATAEKPKSAEHEELIEVPPPVPKSGVSVLAHKLWIGNLDKRLTEQNILRFVTKYGTVVSFRYLFRTGPERAETRDYVFAEFSSREEAERARENLNGKKALGKKIIVDWAKQDQGAKNSNSVSETWDVSSVSDTLSSKGSTSAKIAALEAKLKQMEETQTSGFEPPIKKRKQDLVHHRRSPFYKATGTYSAVNLTRKNSRQSSSNYLSKVARRSS